MFYCTVYNCKSKLATTKEVVLCLSYDSENSARAFRQFLLGKATQAGATVTKQDNYYFIAGKVSLSFAYGFSQGRYDSYYIVGLESDDNVGALATVEGFTKDKARDGLDWEKRGRESRAERDLATQKENEYIDKRLAEFKTEIENKNLKETLISLIKYSQYVRGANRDRLLDIAVDKLQGNTKTSGWYDELSDINN